MKTTPTTIDHVGPPPWPEVAGQRSCKYASPTVARSVALPWVAALIDRMMFAGANLVDIRWWEHLRVGELPGIPIWHYDCVNVAAGDLDEEHRLYFAGAGCRTMFWPDYQPEEGWIIEYNHGARHRVMPATVEGPRLLVRVTRGRVKPQNRIGPPPLIGR